MPTDDRRPQAAEASTTSGFHAPKIGGILFERFLVEEDISDPTLAGGFSAFVVKDIPNYCRRVVLKIVNRVEPEPIPTGPSFRHVCDVLMQLGHPGVEGVAETGTLFDGRPFALMSSHGLPSLAELVAGDRRLPREQAAAIVGEVSETLGALHRRGILHCDLRPENILISSGTGSRTFKLANFGSAWPIDVRGERLAKLADGDGGLFYAAPELLTTLGHRSHVSDVYSLAVLAYRLLSGSLPFAADDRDDLLRMIHAGEPDRLTLHRTDISDDCEEIIFSGLQFEPAYRPQNIEEFGTRLVRALDPPRGIARPTETEGAASGAAEKEVASEPRALLSSEQLATLAERSAETVPDLVFTSFQTAPKPRNVSDRAIAWTLIGLLLAGAASIPIAQLLRGPAAKASEPGTVLARSPEDRSARAVRYKFDQNRSEAPGKMMANQVELVCDSPGNLYLFNEFTDATGNVGFRRQDLGTGASAVAAGSTIKTSFGDLSSSNGVWIVWTASQNPELEQIKAGEGTIGTERARDLRHYLERNRNLRLSIESAGGAGTVLKGVGDRVVHRIELSSDLTASR